MCFLDSPLPLHRAGKDLDDSWSGSFEQRLSGIWGAQSGSLRQWLADVWPYRGEGRGGRGKKGGEAAAATPAARLRRAAPVDCLPVGSGIFGLSDEIRIQDVQVPAGVMRLTTVNGQNRAAFVDNKRNVRKCNCHASVTLIGSILSLVIILRIITKSQSSKNKSLARLRAPRLSEPMTAADRAVVALRTRRHNRSK